MVVINTSVTISMNGIWASGIDTLIDSSMKNAVNRSTKYAELKSKERFLELKKSTPKLPSFIIDSFKIEPVKKTGNRSYIGVIYAGGPESQAPYAIYVDQDHPLRNRRMWSEVNPNAPYKFMEYGLVELSKIINKITLEEINKEMRRIMGIRKTTKSK